MLMVSILCFGFGGRQTYIPLCFDFDFFLIAQSDFLSFICQLLLFLSTSTLLRPFDSVRPPPQRMTPERFNGMWRRFLLLEAINLGLIGLGWTWIYCSIGVLLSGDGGVLCSCYYRHDASEAAFALLAFGVGLNLLGMGYKCRAFFSSFSFLVCFSWLFALLFSLGIFVAVVSFHFFFFFFNFHDTPGGSFAGIWEYYYSFFGRNSYLVNNKVLILRHIHTHTHHTHIHTRRGLVFSSSHM